MTAKFKVGDRVRSGASGVTLTIVAVGPASYLYTDLANPTLDFRMTHVWADENCVLLPPPPKVHDTLPVYQAAGNNWLYTTERGNCVHVGDVISYDDGTIEYKVAP